MGLNGCVIIILRKYSPLDWAAAATQITTVEFMYICEACLKFFVITR